MLSNDKIKELIGKDLIDKEVEHIKNDLYELANIIFTQEKKSRLMKMNIYDKEERVHQDA